MGNQSNQTPAPALAPAAVPAPPSLFGGKTSQFSYRDTWSIGTSRIGRHVTIATRGDPFPLPSSSGTPVPVLAGFVIASTAGGVAKTGRSCSGIRAEQLASFLLGKNKSSFQALICGQVKHFHGVMPSCAPDDRPKGPNCAPEGRRDTIQCSARKSVMITSQVSTTGRPVLLCTGVH